MESLRNLKLHWMAPLQTKGFLKLIEFVLAILTLSLVAGFSVNAHFRCKENYDDVITFRFKYPFSTYTTINGSTQVTTNTERYQYHQANSGAVLLVTWGVFTMFYCVIAVMVYVVFTANERLERVVDCLVYLDLATVAQESSTNLTEKNMILSKPADLAFNLVWVLCFFIVFVEWTVAFRGMRKSIMNDILPSVNATLLHCVDSTVEDIYRSQDSYSQAAVASVFGFVSVILWTVNIYWIVIDTAIYIQWMAKRSAAGYKGDFF